MLVVGICQLVDHFSDWKFDNILLGHAPNTLLEVVFDPLGRSNVGAEVD